MLERRAAGLVAYQGDHLALKYIQFVEDVWSAERRITEHTELSEAVARGLHKLMAYKDEYEVARMLTDAAFIESVRRQVPDGENLTYKLHPPVLKALGRKRRSACGRAATGRCDCSPRADFCAAPGWTRSATRTCGDSNGNWSPTMRR